MLKQNLKMIAIILFFVIKKNTWSQLTISGGIDAYFNHENTLLNKNEVNSTNYKTSFIHSQDKLNLGMATVKAEYSKKKWGLLLDVGFGNRANEFSYTEPNNSLLSTIKQAVLSYSVNDKIKISLGTWATHIGYEVVDPWMNKNYSMSYLFTNGPFSHLGAKIEYVKGNHNLMLGLCEPADRRIPLSKDVPAIIFQYGYTHNSTSHLYLNYYGAFLGYNMGSDLTIKVNQFDLVADKNLGDKFRLAVNGSLRLIQEENNDLKNWYGLALYASYQALESFAFHIREEYFAQSTDGLVINQASSIMSSTLSANWTKDKFSIIPEFRIDNSQNPYFYNDKGTANSNFFYSLIIAGIYKF